MEIVPQTPVKRLFSHFTYPRMRPLCLLSLEQKIFKTF